MVEVTESAKAAIDLLTKIEEYDHACDCDDCNSLRTHTLPFVVQAFATHRIEAAKAERDRIVAWLREAQVEAEDKALNATYSQILHDLAVHGMYVARDGVRVNPDDFYCEPPAKTPVTPPVSQKPVR